MLISQLLSALSIPYKGEDKDIEYITDDSRKCRNGTLFICHANAHAYAADALSRGAVFIVSDESFEGDCIRVKDTRKAFALLSAAFFGNCHKSLRLIGVTGTSGKTTTASMIYTILTVAGKKCGLIGSVSNNTCDGESDAELTTPDCFSIHSMLYSMKKAGAEFCVIEASSQGLVQQRLYGLDFETAVLTNLASDHLDYHKTQENYKKAKLMLFENAHTGIINYDDSAYADFTAALKGKAVSYSLYDNSATYTAKCIEYRQDGTDYAFVGDSIIHRIKLNVPGSFNAANSLAAIAACMEAGVSLFECAGGLRQFYAVKGRMEIVNVDAPFTVIIDYAHTADSLRKSLLFLKSIKKGRLITVFGCGGDRDRKKRSEMGAVAGELSDITVVTSDNPRHEKPEDIINDILSGMKKSKKSIYIHENRKKAVEYALQRAAKNDIIFLAGKGHETSQQIGDRKIPFDEREIVRAFFKKQE